MTAGGVISVPRADDPIEQARAQHKREPENIVTGVVKKGLEKIPFAGIGIAYIRGRAKEEKEQIFDDTILDILKSHEISLDEIKKKLEEENVIRVITASAERIFWGASEKKVKRFAAVVANAIETEKSDQQLEDAALYIRALDELSEDDINVLKHLYKHQSRLVQENHAMDVNSFFHGGQMVNMLRDVGYLKMQMDDFYARCERLAGYGLALPLERRPLEMLLDDRAFRMTLMGKRLVDILLPAGH